MTSKDAAKVPSTKRPLSPVQASLVTLTGKVFDAIKDAIVDKRLAPGSRVSESALATQLNVSKTPVREALLQLRHIGLVRQTASGLCVVMPSRDAIRQAYEYRAGLERMSAQLCAARASASDAAEIQAAAEESLRAARLGNRKGFRHWDRTFHRLVARSSGNEMLESRIRDCLELTSVLRFRDVPAAGDSAVCAQQHVEVAQAIAAGDETAAADGMQRHVVDVLRIVLAASDEEATE